MYNQSTQKILVVLKQLKESECKNGNSNVNVAKLSSVIEQLESEDLRSKDTKVDIPALLIALATIIEKLPSIMALIEQIRRLHH